MILDIRDTDKEVREVKAILRYTIEKEITIRTDNYQELADGTIVYLADEEERKKHLARHNPLYLIHELDDMNARILERIKNFDDERVPEQVRILQEEAEITKGWGIVSYEEMTI